MHRRGLLLLLAAALASGALAGCMGDDGENLPDETTQPRYGREIPESEDGVSGDDPQVVETDGGSGAPTEGG